LLEEQRRADEEAKKLADAAKKRAAAKAEAERLAAARRCEERIKTTMAKGAIEFQFNSAALSDQSGAAVLDALAEAVRNCEGRLSIIVEGHTDSTGSKAGNLKLSEQRAAAVAEYLRKKGVAGDNISSSGFGASKPIASNRTASGRAKNRRIEFRVK
jgi:OOP family OmpA-OmpF porin